MAIFELQGPDRVTTVNLSGRPAWLLFRLIDAGQGGLTAADLPAGLRVSSYVHKLRSAGVQITTRYEASDGAFGGAHGRFILASKVKPMEEAAT